MSLMKVLSSLHESHERTLLITWVSWKYYPHYTWVSWKYLYSSPLNRTTSKIAWLCAAQSFPVCLLTHQKVNIVLHFRVGNTVKGRWGNTQSPHWMGFENSVGRGGGGWGSSILLGMGPWASFEPFNSQPSQLSTLHTFHCDKNLEIFRNVPGNTAGTKLYIT